MWLFSSRQHGSAKQVRRPSSRPPQLELLEDRCVPSSGPLDPTFGSGGIVTTAIGTSADAYAVALQPDGKVLAGGTSSTPSGRSTIDHFTLARYTTGGALDTTFGSGGKAVTSWGKGGNTSADAYAMAVYPNSGTVNDGKIVLAGFAGTKTGDQFALARYNPNGSLDTSFGSGGTVSTVIGARQSQVDGVAIQPDGKILVVGEESDSTGVTLNPLHLAVARYNPNGTLDTTFGSNGAVFSPIGTWQSEGRAVALQADGKIVVAGYFYLNQQTQFAVFRYTPNGTLDTTFGGSTGYAAFTADPRGSATFGAYSVVIQADGKIVAGGSVRASYGQSWQLTRFNADGSLDSTFGGTGLVEQPVWGYAAAVALQQNGKIVAAGPGNVTIPSSTFFFEVGRFNADGSSDQTFNGTGLVGTPIGSSSSWAFGVAIQPTDGKIVVAGASPYSTSADDFALARYLATGPQIGSFTASPNPVASGSSLTLTASSITGGNPNSTVTQVAFYVQVNGTNTLLGYGTQTSPGVWTFTFTVNLAPGTYTLFAQAEDNYGLFGDAAALLLQVLMSFDNQNR
jgi:uncharacterized delta-60 repeat protein